MQSADYCEKEHPDTNMYPSSKRKESENTSPEKRKDQQIAGLFSYPRGESNAYRRNRNPKFYPLNYRGIPSVYRWECKYREFL